MANDYVLSILRAAARAAGLPEWLIIAQATQESGLNPDAVGGVGELGLMQVRPEIWGAWARRRGWDLRRPEHNALAGAHILASSIRAERGNITNGLRRYNGGPRWASKPQTLKYAQGVFGRAREVTPTQGGGELSGSHLVKLALASRSIQFSPRARQDVVAGAVDPRVLGVLLIVANQHSIKVSTVKSGHNKMVAGTDRVSNHFFGRAVDINAVDGKPVSANNPAARAAMQLIATAGAAYGIDDLGGPWSISAGNVRSFTDDAHGDHIHVGFDDPAKRDWTLNATALGVEGEQPLTVEDAATRLAKAFAASSGNPGAAAVAEEKLAEIVAAIRGPQEPASSPARPLAEPMSLRPDQPVEDEEDDDDFAADFSPLRDVFDAVQQHAARSTGVTI